MDPCVIQDTGTYDEVWIPVVTKQGLVIITRDRHIERRTWEKDQVLACRARMFAITSEENLDTWGLAEIVFTQWRNIEAAAEEPGPYIYSLTSPQDRPLLSLRASLCGPAAVTLVAVGADALTQHLLRDRQGPQTLDQPMELRDPEFEWISAPSGSKSASSRAPMTAEGPTPSTVRLHQGISMRVAVE